jgi:DNA-binding SARP family transcriptional activator/tetratricopeptide (TPR) repeat protein
MPRRSGNGIRVIEVSLLGPPRVHRDGALVAFDTRKALALLAHLALPDRPRSRDSLAHLLWPDTDPDRARGALRRTLSTLRAVVGAELVEATSDHVRLIKDHTIEVDVDRFRTLRADGDPEGAVHLFRGDFLEGFVVRGAPNFEDWAQQEGAALRRELVATLADLVHRREAADDPSGALVAAQRWLSLDPLHEPAHRALIRLYAVTGDRAAALIQYRECVRALSRELGVPPLTETTQLYEAINRGSFSAASTSRSAPPPPPRPPAAPFVGRGAELNALRAQYEAIGDDGRVVVIEGEAGIGKTRLADELVAGLVGHGANVLVGRSYEDESGLPYAPVIEAIRGAIGRVDEWRGTAGDSSIAGSARLVPELAGAQPGAELPPLEGPGAATRFFAGVWDTLAAAAGGSRPGVLLLDDAQWADDATLRLLTYGLRRLQGRRLLLVLTWRTPHDHPLRRAVTASARADRGTVVHLDRLTPGSVETLVRSALPDVDKASVSRRLWEKTEGVPLLLVEYLHALAAGDDWALPAGARDLMQSRLDPVSETGRQVLSAAAVLGRSFDVETVRLVSGRSEEETVAAVEEVVRHGLVLERELTYDFGHDLLRGLIYDQTSLARRRLLHARAAETLRSPAARARHFTLAGNDGAAALAHAEAAALAGAVFANAESLAHLHAAVALGHPDVTGCTLDIADVQMVMGDYADALISLRTAAAACAPDQVSEVEHRLGRLHHRRGEYDLAQSHLQAALSAAGAEARARAGLLTDLSLATHSLGDTAEASRLAAEAQARADETGDVRARCQAHNVLGMLATEAGDTDGAVGHLEQSLALANQLPDQALTVAALNNLALAHRASGGHARALELTTAALGLCAAMGDRHREAALHNNLADLLHEAGRGDEAMAHLKSAVAIFAEIGAEDGPRPEIWKLVHW